jgi:hypothetical protein
MGAVKARQIQQSDILRLEAEMNNLWGELNTSNIPHNKRMELEEKLNDCEDNFKAVLGGQAPFGELEANLHKCDMELALAAITQAENEIPKTEHTSSAFLALENIRHELNEKRLTPVHARHEIKEVMRHHS